MINLGVASVAAAMLLYEVALTRVFSLAYGYHFAFLAISLGLLGFGSSGSLLALRPRWQDRLTPAVLARLSLLASLALVLGYVVANRVPFDPYRAGWEPLQLLLLAAYLVSLAVPFILVGLVLGMPVVTWPDRAGPIYAANLAGSAAGALLALAVLSRTIPSAGIVLAGMLAALGSLSFAASSSERPRVLGIRSRMGRPAALTAFALVGLLAALALRSPEWLEVRLSPYKALPQLLARPDARLLFRGSNALSRLDVVDSPGIHSAPGLSLDYEGGLPEQTAVAVDGEALLTLTSREGLSPDFLDGLPGALAYRMRPNARVLVLDPGGGLDVLAPLEAGARSIEVVEKNPLLADIIRSRFPSRAGGIYNDPRVRLVVSGARAHLRRSDGRFDLIVLGLPENRRTVAAGAFSLSEDHLMTAEAFDAYLGHLAPGGLVVVHRWLQLPPTEEIRAAALTADALERTGRRASERMIAIRSFSTMLILAKQEPFGEQEIAVVRSFVRDRRFDLVHYPGIRREEANRANVLRSDRYYEAMRGLLSGDDRFYERYEYDVRPPTDARPYFFHFFKWEQTPTVLALLGRTWQPFGGSGYLIIVALLALTASLSTVLILLPTVVLRRRRGGSDAGKRLRAMLYFGALGLGFLLVELALVQRFLLLLGHPAPTFAIVVFGLLAASGGGSSLSGRVPWRPAMGLLVVLLCLYPWVVSAVVAAFVGHGLPVRALVTLILLAPLGFLMGIPFPRGLRSLAAQAPDWLPLAWATNGFMSVLSAILAAMLGLSWGSAVVLWCGAAAYAVALATVWNPISARRLKAAGARGARTARP